MANMLHDQAVARGATAYVDTKYLHAGMYFKKELITQIKTSDEMLILLSPKFEKSKWLVFETGVSEGAGVLTVPMLSEMPIARISDFEFLRDLHAVAIEDYRQYFDQLETRVKGKLMRGNHIRVMQENISRALQSDAEEQS